MDPRLQIPAIANGTVELKLRGVSWFLHFHMKMRARTPARITAVANQLTAFNCVIDGKLCLPMKSLLEMEICGTDGFAL
jgi:hypothetical protein